ncbi:hypothetical protein COV23_01735 [Candidatus Wolfebacteria bacterium CG10_big_fil_rev_8_21_14_0_10_31_9]|uniref:Vitamin K epoxide reductase domain-containing protein n=1 Tax=Candidatus Wolfebacteria bacterium CG10_big_fil_rev_8_21_14_0_10_31_9 TaxID=1975070 RepID=A0A2H0RC20_9BACT|nr:MAG: hypothetical protein COV23_01735 [Candidatus Wolfebacteria bacterium CG10_big_fil_rev_8_21_14_0_10_31_9]
MDYRKNKILAIVILFLSTVGFIDATYLAIKKLFGGQIPCYVFSGCDIVNTSVYSSIFGIPLSLFGVIFYVSVFILMIRFLETKNNWYLKTIFYLSIFGFLISLYLIVIQVFIIKALCLYCIISAIGSTLIFAIFVYSKIKARF